MRLRHELTYDATVDDVRAMLGDPAYWDRVAVATGARSSTTTVTPDDTGVLVLTEEEQRVGGVPAFARKFVGDSTRVLKRQHWTGTTSTFEVQTPGKPTRITGVASLEEHGSGTTLAYDLEVTASVPLVGGRLEKLVGELTAAGFDKEQATGVAWLKGERR